MQLCARRIAVLLVLLAGQLMVGDPGVPAMSPEGRTVPFYKLVLLHTWSIVKKVLQNLTSLFSKMTSRIEERAQERMTKKRRTR